MCTIYFISLAMILSLVGISKVEGYQQKFYFEGLMTIVNHISDLTPYLDKLEKVDWVCPTGFWIGYRDINYENYEEAWGSSDGSCSPYNHKYKSLRFGGAAMTGEAISFYQSDSWQGVEKTYYVDKIDDVKAQSVVVTGVGDLGWEIFEGNNQNGRSACITANRVSNLGSLQSISGHLGWTQIGSALRGCCFCDPCQGETYERRNGSVACTCY